MQTATILLLVCCVAVVASRANRDSYPALDAIMSEGASPQESIYDTPEHDRSPRTKRGLLLLKKKLLLGALGLKALKIGALGAGALALGGKSGGSPFGSSGSSSYGGGHSSSYGGGHSSSYGGGHSSSSYGSWSR